MRGYADIADARETKTCRFSDKEWQEVNFKAKKYTKGNVSKWIRIAAQLYTPPQGADSDGERTD